jgi:hypothetical protein
MFLNLLSGILYVFTRAVDRVASHCAQKRCGGKQQ